MECEVLRGLGGGGLEVPSDPPGCPLLLWKGLGFFSFSHRLLLSFLGLSIRRKRPPVKPALLRALPFPLGLIPRMSQAQLRAPGR